MINLRDDVMSEELNIDEEIERGLTLLSLEKPELAKTFMEKIIIASELVIENSEKIMTKKMINVCDELIIKIFVAPKFAAILY